MSETIGQAPQEAPVTTAPIAESGNIDKTLQSIAAKFGKPEARAVAIRSLHPWIADKLNPLRRSFDPRYDHYSALIAHQIMLAVGSGRIPEGQNLGPVELGEQFHQTLKKAGLNPKDPNLPLNTLAEAFLESVMPARPAAAKQKAESPAPKTTETKIDKAQPQETPATEPTRQEAGATQQPESVRAQATKGLLSGPLRQVKKGVVEFFSRFKKGKPQEQPQQPPGPTQEQTATAVEQVPTDLVTTAQQTPEETVPPAAPAEEPTAHIETIAQPLEVAPAAEEKRQTEEAPAAGVPAEPEITTPTMSKDEAQTDIAGEPPAAAPEAPITEGQKTDEQRAEARESRQEQEEIKEIEIEVEITDLLKLGDGILSERTSPLSSNEISELLSRLKNIGKEELDKYLEENPERIFLIGLEQLGYLENKRPDIYDVITKKLNQILSNQDLKDDIKFRLFSWPPYFLHCNAFMLDQLLDLEPGKDPPSYFHEYGKMLLGDNFELAFSEIKRKITENPLLILATRSWIFSRLHEYMPEEISEIAGKITAQQVRDVLKKDPASILEISPANYMLFGPNSILPEETRQVIINAWKNARIKRQEPTQLAEPDRIVPVIKLTETEVNTQEVELGIKDIFEITGYGLDSLPNQEKDKILLLIKSIDKNHPEKLGQFFIHLDLNPKAFFTLDWRIHDLFSEEVKSLIQKKLTSLKERFSENSNFILEDPLILLRSSWIGFKSFFGKEGKAHIWSDMPTLIEEKMPGFFEQLKQKMRDNPTSVLTMTDDAIQIFFPEQQHDPIRESIRNLSKEQVRDFLEADPLNPLRINYKVYEALDPEAQKLVDLATYRIKIKSE